MLWFLLPGAHCLSYYKSLLQVVFLGTSTGGPTSHLYRWFLMPKALPAAPRNFTTRFPSSNTWLAPKVPFISSVAATKRLKPDLRGKKSEVVRLLQSHRPHPSGRRLERVGAAEGLEWKPQQRTSALPCLCSVLPPSAVNMKKQHFSSAGG